LRCPPPWVGRRGYGDWLSASCSAGRRSSSSCSPACCSCRRHRRIRREPMWAELPVGGWRLGCDARTGKSFSRGWFPPTATPQHGRSSAGAGGKLASPTVAALAVGDRSDGRRREAEMTDQATRRPAVSWQVDQWLRRRSSHASDWPVEKLLSLKGAATVSVVIPARNEASTVGEIVRTIRGELVDRAGLVDELVVVDSRSTDDTARVAAQAGATVVAEQEVLAQLPPMQGKGEALWKGMAASTGDLVVFVDGDLREFSATYVTGLLGPLLADESVVYVKGFYRRPFVGDGEVQPDGGGRVTELVARPLLNMHWPSLAGF